MNPTSGMLYLVPVGCLLALLEVVPAGPDSLLDTYLKEQYEAGSD